MVAPIRDDFKVVDLDIRQFPVQEELYVQRNKCCIKVQKIVIPLLLIFVDSVFLYFSVDSWKRGDKIPVIVFSALNLAAGVSCLAWKSIS